jgi:TolA-binding protein
MRQWGNGVDEPIMDYMEHGMKRLRIVAMAVAVVLAGVGTAWAQAATTEADVNRLESSASEVAKLVTQLKTTDPTRAADVEKQLTTLREEIVYLRVKLRRNGVTRAEYSDVRDRLETLRVRAAGDKVSSQPIVEDDPMVAGRVWTVPVGTELDVRLQTALNSGTAKLEQRFEATTIVDLAMDGNVVIPAGTIVRGFVGSVRPATRTSRQGSLTLSFDEVVLKSGPARMRATVTKALDGKMSEDASRVGTGAVVGAILGGLLGGGKGLLVGVLVGGGGTIAATDGANVDLPPGTILRLRVDSPLEIR